MSAPQPELDVANSLATALSLNVGTTIMLGPRRSVVESGNAAAVVWVAPTGGDAPQAYLGAQVTGSLWFPVLQVLILSDDEKSFSTGLTRARAARDALHTKTIPISGGGSYTYCDVRESDPRYLGRNEAQQHQWVLNVELAYPYKN